MARRRGLIPKRLARKLTLIDHAFALVRHISEISVESFIQELSEALKGELGEGTKHSVRGEKGQAGEKGEKGGKDEKGERDQDGEEGVQGPTDEKTEDGRTRGVHPTSIRQGHTVRYGEVAQDGAEKGETEAETVTGGEETMKGEKDKDGSGMSRPELVQDEFEKAEKGETGAETVTGEKERKGKQGEKGGKKKKRNSKTERDWREGRDGRGRAGREGRER